MRKTPKHLPSLKTSLSRPNDDFYGICLVLPDFSPQATIIYKMEITQNYLIEKQI